MRCLLRMKLIVHLLSPTWPPSLHSSHLRMPWSEAPRQPIRCLSHRFPWVKPNVFFIDKKCNHFRNQSSVATVYPPQWQTNEKKKTHSRAWHTELGAKHQQVALSLRRGPWALEWNGQRGFVLCDEWRWRCCLWSDCLAGYRGAAAKVEDHRSARPRDFTAEAGLSSRMLVANAELQRAGLEWHFKPVNVAECGHRNARACVCLGNSCLFLSQRLLFSHHSNAGWQQDSGVVPYWQGAHTQAEGHEWHISNPIWKEKDKV